MGIKKQLNVRIPLELQEKIDNDGRPKVDIVIEALELYFASKNPYDDSIKDQSFNNDASQKDSNVDKSDSNVSKIEQIDSNEVTRMKGEIEFLRAKIDDILKLLHQEQVLHIQTQRMLTAPPQPVQKKWWQFWS
jgi:predicted DNA-binding protein